MAIRKDREDDDNDDEENSGEEEEGENSYFSTTRHPAELSWRIVSVSCSLQETK